jgi:menaquinone-dependent protoporphyrinogen IX oxidase
MKTIATFFSAVLLTAQLINAQEATMKHVLIAYGSTKGSTAEIAKRMKGYLEEKNCVVDTLPVSASVVDFAKYDLIIIGSGIYGGSPHENIKPFIDNNRVSLQQKKVAVFALCVLRKKKQGKKQLHLSIKSLADSLRLAKLRFRHCFQNQVSLVI